MKTKDLIRSLFSTDAFHGAQKREALETLIRKLDKKRAKLKRKLDEEESEVEREALEEKLALNKLHDRKARRLLAELGG